MVAGSDRERVCFGATLGGERREGEGGGSNAAGCNNKLPTGQPSSWPPDRDGGSPGWTFGDQVICIAALCRLDPAAISEKEGGRAGEMKANRAAGKTNVGARHQPASQTGADEAWASADGLRPLCRPPQLGWRAESRLPTPTDGWMLPSPCTIQSLQPANAKPEGFPLFLSLYQLPSAKGGTMGRGEGEEAQEHHRQGEGEEMK